MNRKDDHRLFKLSYMLLPYLFSVCTISLSLGSWLVGQDTKSDDISLTIDTSEVITDNYVTFTSVTTNMLEYNGKHYRDVDNTNPIDENRPGAIIYTFKIKNERPAKERIYFSFELTISGIRSSMQDYVPNSFLLPSNDYWWVISENRFNFSTVKNNEQVITNARKGDIPNPQKDQAYTNFAMEFRFKDFSANRDFNKRLSFKLKLNILN